MCTALLAGGLVTGLALTGGGSTPPSNRGPAGVSEVAAMFDGVTQNGAMLGRPEAPVTLVEFADPQCPYCARWATQTLPAVITRYVRSGKVRIVFNGMDFVGPDSETALRAALAAGKQNRFWNVLELLYENQGTENTGWVTDSFLQSLGEGVPGLDWRTMLNARHSASVDDAIARAASLAHQAGVNSTPSFAVGPTGGQLELVTVSSLDVGGIAPAIDAALEQ
ncbi:MAG: DsbA family protein [Gaiellaceae bacterium]